MWNPEDPWTLGVPARSASPADMLDLSGTSNPLGCAPMAARRIVEAAGSVPSTDRDSLHRLVDALSRKFSVKPDRICVGAGTRILLPALLRALGGAQRAVAMSAPAPPLHRLAAAVAGVRVIDVPLTHEFDHAMEAWLTLLARERPAVALLGHPTNPGGRGADAADMGALLEAAAAAGTTVVVDEAYAEYAEKPDFVRLAPLLEESPHLVLMRSFSSLQGLSGAPVAYTVSAAETATTLRPHTVGLEPCDLAARAAEAALGEPSFDQMMRDRVGRSRFSLSQALHEWGVPCRAGVAPWVIAQVKDSADVTRRLAARGLRVRDLGPWGMAGWIRVRAGTEAELARFLKDAKPLLTRSR